MKKIFIVIVSSIMLCLFMGSPSIVKASGYEWQIVGEAYIIENDQQLLVDIYCYVEPNSISMNYSGWFSTSSSDFLNYYLPNEDVTNPYSAHILDIQHTHSAYIPTLNSDQSFNYNNQRTVWFYKVFDDYYDSLPEELLPEDPSLISQIWDSFYDLFELAFGYRPQPGSFIDTLRDLSEGDRTESTEIYFPTATPTPTLTPTPTPIPVQTIFVPDGNGNTTIIYQYPDPTTGVITQSPYNPNVTNNIEVNCNCDGGSGGGSNPFSSSPQDPYTLDASLFWADGFGVEMSDSPLSVADDSQTNLKTAAEEYNSSVEVLSNSFNILPIKWITLVGLLGGILIIAGLIRTFLGG